MNIPSRRLLLVGAGHANVEVLRRLALARPRDVAVTLLTPHAHTQYSGMLPGLVAGHYDIAETRIDAAALARAAGARFVADRATFIDTLRGRVFRESGCPLDYDLLSLDTGGIARVTETPAIVPARPAETLLAHLPGLDRRAAAAAPLHLAVIGGGAAGVELAFAFEARLRPLRRAAGRDPAVVTLACGPAGLLPGFPPALIREVRALCARRGIRIRPAALPDEPADLSIWATGVTAPPWLAGSGLALDAQGFVAVGPTLRSLSHDNVFAAGDIAGFASSPLPKSGLQAVRQGPILAENLRRTLVARPLRAHRPPRAGLQIIATGADHAIAARNGIVVSGAWVRRWKDLIDRRFIARYRLAPADTA